MPAATIDTLLETLIAKGEAGDWDDIVSMLPQITGVLDAAEEAWRSAPPTGQDREATTRLLQRATALCETRREQIAPLVEALSLSPDTKRT